MRDVVLYRADSTPQPFGHRQKRGRTGHAIYSPTVSDTDSSSPSERVARAARSMSRRLSTRLLSSSQRADADIDVPKIPSGRRHPPQYVRPETRSSLPRAGFAEARLRGDLDRRDAVDSAAITLPPEFIGPSGRHPQRNAQRSREERPASSPRITTKAENQPRHGLGVDYSLTHSC